MTDGVFRHDGIDALRFWVTCADEPAYEVDLREFALGGSITNLPPLARPSWSGDFQGRARLAHQFAAYFRVLHPSSARDANARAAMRNLFRYLDFTESRIQGVEELSDFDGQRFKSWLEIERGDRWSYRTAKQVVDAIRQIELLPPLLWPARGRDRINEQKDIDVIGMQRLYNGFKEDARSIKRMFAEGKEFLRIGRDPRRSFSRSNETSWHHRKNHAWLVGILTAGHLLSSEEFADRSAAGLIKANYASQYHLGPEYIAPGMTERGREGIVGKLRWFHPSYQDTAVYLWLFMVGTGWNLATSLGIDISSDGEWFEPHPSNAEINIIHAFKRRADRHQFTPSLVKPEWHPFRIIKFMIDRTAALRETLKRELRDLENRFEISPSVKLKSEIDHLVTSIRSPWLYHTINKVGRVSSFSHDDSHALNEIARIVAEREGLLEEHPSLSKVSTSDTRDAWLGYAWIESNHDLLLTSLAAQHRSVSTTRDHYLNRRQFKKHSERSVRKIHSAVFSEIESKMAIDATRIRILVENGAITAEQEARLLDHRKRTRVGMGCLKPTEPPAKIAPGHPAGSLCGVQRCTGCENGIVFAESLTPLARAKVELEHIRGTMPLVSWIGSSFEKELQSITATLEQFPADAVAAAESHWAKRLRNGEVMAHDTYPA
jgi:hypothetical protein